MLGAMAHATDDTANAARPTSSGGRRPTRSLMGPSTSWPAEMPIMQAVRVICTADAPALSFFPRAADYASPFVWTHAELFRDITRAANLFRSSCSTSLALMPKTNSQLQGLLA